MKINFEDLWMVLFHFHVVMVIWCLHIIFGG